MRNSVSDVTDAEILDETREAMTQAAFDAADEANAAQAVESATESLPAFDELGLKKLPTVKTLQAEYAKLLTDKKAAYADYQSAQKEMRELLIHRQNIVQFLGLDAPAVQKEKEHGRD